MNPQEFMQVYINYLCRKNFPSNFSQEHENLLFYKDIEQAKRNKLEPLSVQAIREKEAMNKEDSQSKYLEQITDRIIR